jgi:hypothetical protein
MDQLKELFKHINVNSAMGPDNISHHFLKHAPDSLIRLLLQLHYRYNRNMATQ